MLKAPTQSRLVRSAAKALRFASAVVIAAGSLAGARALAADPEITRQPASGIARVGESFGFSVEATGSTMLSYRWFIGNDELLFENGSSLTLPGVSDVDDGVYTVVVSNASGSVTSAPAALTVTGIVPRTITTGTVTGGSQASVPLLLSANGREQRVVFTLGFDTNVLINPSFQPSVTNEASSLDLSRIGEGLITGDLSLPTGEMFSAGRTEFGRLIFDFVGAANPLIGKLYFTNASDAATNVTYATNGTAMLANAVVSPQFEALTLSPELNRQSGLFEHKLRVAYAGADDLDNVDLLIAGLVEDSATNLIRVYNAIGLKTVGPDVEGYYENVPFVQVGKLVAGASRDLTIEYYVTDHVTVPAPDYRLLVNPATGFRVPASATPLNITTNRFVNGTFIIQWPSRSKYRYFIQYAPTLADLVNTTTNARVVNPAVSGTGYQLQWIDNGPPKTETPPTEGSRFYRVLEVPDTRTQQ